MSDVPQWDLSSIYKGYRDPRWVRDFEALVQGARSLAKAGGKPPQEGALKGPWVERTWKKLLKVGALGANLKNYAEVRFTVDTRDEGTQKELARVEEALLDLKRAWVGFRRSLAGLGVKMSRLTAQRPALKEFQGVLEEEVFWASRQLDGAQEALAADLQRSGGEAFGRLREAISSQITVPWPGKKPRVKTMVELRQLAFDPDRAVRQKAFELELGAWKAWEVPLAACINGVKGSALTLETRRGWTDMTALAARQNRITPAVLEALMGALQEALPQFRKYLKLKAQALEIPACGFYDLFAPVGRDSQTWSFSKARDFIVEKFSGFSPGWGDFAARAFDQGWIDAQPRPGKIGGAYCESFPLAREPRILSNFTGSFSDVKTLAHELGHGYHFWLVRNKSLAHMDYPMTLAETASILGETLVFQGALKVASGDQALFLVENELQDQTQVLVDILSRFLFEKAVFDRRRQGDLSPGDLCGLMVEAQKKTYGSGLDPQALHPYMWAAKTHYYSPDLGFYNFPYAFGLLFSLALYRRAEAEGPAFVTQIDQLLAQTGVRSAVDLAGGLGYNLEDIGFWKEGLGVFTGLLKDFEKRLGNKKSPPKKGKTS